MAEKESLDEARLAQARDEALRTAQGYTSTGVSQAVLDEAALAGLEEAIASWSAQTAQAQFSSYLVWVCRQRLKAVTSVRPDTTSGELRGAQLVARAIEFLKKKGTKADPLPASEVAALQLGDGLPLPASVATWFGFQRKLPEPFGLRSAWPAAMTVNDFMKHACKALRMPAPKQKPRLDGLVHLLCASDSSHEGLWLGVDEAGEHPVIQVREDEGRTSLRIAHAGFDLYVARWAGICTPAEQVAHDQLAKALERRVSVEGAERPRRSSRSPRTAR